LHKEVGIFGQPIYFEKDFSLSSLQSHHMELRKVHELGIILDRETSLIFRFTSVQKESRMPHEGI